jgi:BASS family bile acid:Na+ symporter
MHDAFVNGLKIAMGVIIPLASVATGLRAAAVDPLWLFKRPSLLLRSLLAVLVLVPAATFALLEVMRPSMVLEAGLLVAILAVGIGPPAVFKHTSQDNAHLAYEVEMNVVLLALAIAYIPATLAVLGAYFQRELHLNASMVARLVLTRSLVPLLAGVLLARFVPKIAGPLGRIAAPVIQVVLLVVILVALFATWRGLFAMGPHGWLICAAVAAGAVVIGHLCGGPDPAERRVLAILSAMRFPGLALLIASVLPNGRTVIPVVLAYVLCSVVCLAIYGAIAARRRRRAEQRGIPLRPVPKSA